MKTRYQTHLKVVILAVLGNPLQVGVGVHQVLSSFGDLRSDQGV